ncbi:MAG: endo-1,4-beta-xylanase, partial [Patescibacteria group bacterium]
EIVTRLARQGLIDKVGLQMHIDNQSMRASPDDVVRTIRSYGIPAAATEFDVDLRDEDGTERDRLTLQAQVYESMIRAALRSGVIKDVGFWGYGDALTGIDSSEFGGTHNADPTMWDWSDRPKPAYYAVRKVLLEKASNQI